MSNRAANLLKLALKNKNSKPCEESGEDQSGASTSRPAPASQRVDDKKSFVEAWLENSGASSAAPSSPAPSIPASELSTFGHIFSAVEQGSRTSEKGVRRQLDFTSETYKNKRRPRADAADVVLRSCDLDVLRREEPFGSSGPDRKEPEKAISDLEDIEPDAVVLSSVIDNEGGEVRNEYGERELYSENWIDLCVTEYADISEIPASAVLVAGDNYDPLRNDQKEREPGPNQTEENPDPIADTVVVHPDRDDEAAASCSAVQHNVSDVTNTGNESVSLLETPPGTSRDGSLDHSGGSSGTRKRSRNATQWKKNLSKAGCNSGTEYVSQSGKVIPARKVGEACKAKCKLKCRDRISDDDRKLFFKQYWALNDHTRQWDFLNKYVSFKDPTQPNLPNYALRSVGNYSILTSDGSLQRVCMPMFLSTLSISERTVRTAYQRLKKKGATISPDKRGLHPKLKRNMKDLTATIDEHIGLFKVVPSHYCRIGTKRKYLEPGLSIQKMYRMYVTWMHESKPGKEIASSRKYRDRFNTAYNYGFHMPKKDQCVLCNVYTRGNPQIKEKLEAKRDEHLQNSNIARQVRAADKIRGQNDPSVCVAIFDLQKVLVTPKDETSVLYYKSKLATYNLTVFNAVTLAAYCFVWHEGEGKRGANDIGSCLLEFIKLQLAHYPETKEFVFWSDNCSGQNKNKYLYALMTILCKRFFVKITIRYMETGHTQSACDSVHSTIERAAKGQAIFTPEGWYRVIENAKTQGEKYQVIRMNSKFVEMHHFCETFQKWNGHAHVNWKLLREVLFDPNESPGTVLVKSSLTGDAAVTKVNVMKANKGRPPNLATHTLPPAYTEPLRLKAGKLKDLGVLCGDHVIPVEYHDFYKTLVGFKIKDSALVDNAEISNVEASTSAAEASAEVTAEEEELWALDGEDSECEDWYIEEVQRAEAHARAEAPKGVAEDIEESDE